MKRIALFILLLIAAVAMKAQVSTQNYVRTRTMLNSTGNSYVDDIAYYDGLGRPFEFVQKVAKNGTKTGSPIATLQEYDALGRETNTWLPIKTTTDYLTPATFKSNAPGNYNNDAYPYSQTSYDDSPLNRINTLYGPGNAWRNGWHTIDLDHTFNSASSPLHCIKYSVNSTGGLVKAGNYAAGLLHVVKTTDEDDNVSYTFTDEQGHVLLERRMNGKEPHDTYYVYNDLDNLCFVLQPMYQESGSLEKHAFQYQYDNLNRCVRKVLPGCQYIEYVYDNADRITFSQDGNQRTKGLWTYYLYDKLGRLTEQGECVDKNTSSGGKTVLVKYHYDNYNFVGSNGFTNTYFTKDTSGYGKGRLTGCEMSVLGSTAKLYAAYYYNVKGLNIKTVEGNLLGGHDVTTTTYTFTGNPATVTHTHTASGKPSCTETYTYTYDHKDRVSKVEHTLGGTKITLNTLTYDDLGRLQSQSFHGSAANKTTYSYNIRDWLTGISSAKLEQDLWYNNGLFSKKYNGSIGEMTWRAGNETTVRRYTYTYDGLDRLTAANYGEGSDYNKHSFDEQVIGYDKNGNITGLQRYGQTGASAYGLIDNLTFTLDGNRQTRIDDGATAAAYNGGFEFKDGMKQANEYVYDANGNLTKDLNKNISSIQYNCLNLPQVVTFSDGSTITYTYAADGTKLRTVHKIGGTTITTDYCGNVVYENGTPKYLLTEEGYVTLADKKYHYFLKDHQGNNRVVVDAAGTVEEVNHYYPFGGTFASTSVQPYKYNGKEYDDKKGLNWYDYGARMYDAAIGRFITVDPSVENYYYSTPYAYCESNPINRTDPTGTDWIQDRYGSFLWDANATSQETTRRGWTYVGTALPEDTHPYHVLEEINGKLYHKNTTNLFASVINWVAGKQVLVEKKPYNPVEDQAMEQVVGIGSGIVAGSAVGKVAGKIIGSFAKSPGKGFSSFSAFKKAYGPAGEGQAWHHIVEQNPSNLAKFGAERIHNTNNLIKLPNGKGSIHAKISGYYSSKPFFTNGLTVRDWLRSQSFEEQYKFGIETLKKFGWKP